MSANQIKVRRKEIPPTNWKKINLFICLAVLIFLGAAVTIVVTAFPDRFNFSFAPLEVVADGNRQIIRVPAGGDIQAAVNRAKSGDIIELKAGATYYGEIILPDKDLTDYITIQTSAVNQLPENQRIKPDQANLLAKIVSRGKGQPALSTAKGAHHYRLIGIEFAPSNSDYIYNLIYFGEPEKVSETAHHLEIDRCYIHRHKTGKTRRGVALNSADTIIKNSYIEGFAYEGGETQGICGWTGTKNVLLLNNYIEGGAENVMFGGSDPVSADLIPADIEVRGNYFYKPPEWQNKVSVKTLFELKNAKRVRFVENYLENNWVGSAFRITVRNDGGTAPFSTLEDILIKDNIIKGAGEGINILGSDDIHPSQMLKDLKIINNLFLDIGIKPFTGSGYFIQISGGEDILIAGNTAFNSGNLVTFYGDLPKNFLFRDNIAGHGTYGIHGLSDIKSVGRKLFQNNIIVNNRGINEYDSSYPPGNFWIADYKSVGFVNLENKDFRLAPNSRFKQKNGNVVGFDAEKIPATLKERL